MEYIDGEDLSSLLRRIGRLPSDKAIAIARQICAGVAAAHERGVLHRDLKPANIMLDGRGDARITDFGLAGLTNDIQGGEIRSGTPAYMAPEQLSGKEVSIRSDIYSLGLVLYELSTGRPAFEAKSIPELQRLQHESSIPSPSELVRDLEPAVERVILRCLNPDPRRRPQSALSIAAALPGGDPLAAALAAGETPSPDMVAQAGEQEGIRPSIAIGAVAAVIVLLGALGFVGQRISLIKRIPFDMSADELTARARDITQRLGYPRSSHYTSGLYPARMVMRWSGAPENRYVAGLLNSGRPYMIYLWYRQAATDLVPLDSRRIELTPNDPPPVVGGMVQMDLDTHGRMISFSAVPSYAEGPPPQLQPVDWAALFVAAGLDLSSFKSVDPTWFPNRTFDTRAAWAGAFSEIPAVPIRIEAAGFRGKPVFFQVIGPWTLATDLVLGDRRGSTLNQYLTVGVTAVISLASLVLARRNIRLGRGDRRGAMRLGIFVLLASLSSSILKATHNSGIFEMQRIVAWTSWALFLGTLVAVLYLALEPLVRKRWPQTIVSWTRLLAGDFGDPVVARDVLIGLLFGLASGVLFQAREWIAQTTAGIWFTPNLTTLIGARHAFGEVLQGVVDSISFAFVVFCFLFLARVLLRKDWVAGVVLVAVYGVVGASRVQFAPWPSLIYVLQATFGTLVLLRFGVLPLVMGVFISGLFSQLPVTLDLTSWYGTPTIVSFAVVIAMASYAVRYAVASQPFFREDL